ncbi:hypothetical protein [Nocardioides sp. GY 10127]|uniref:hypothetical protein n=1 Tax=Nocardioides sp. GY 10127 TaxID=2569762 RepID=UPI0010A8059C|nr:hypothetical protein [Nocardioides sp. GY 10127]TIC79121.1 hypothetical protein E8D37_18350 [Nocardioides sp. GY 10127]
MEAALALGAVVPAALGTGCCVAMRARTAWADSAAMVLMLLAMLDSMLSPAPLLSGESWALLLGAAALGLWLLRGDHHRLRTLHLAVMAALVWRMGAAMGSAGMSGMSGMEGTEGAAGTSGVTLLGVPLLDAVLVGVAVAAAVPLVLAAVRSTSWLVRGELAAGAASMLAMGAMLV